MIRYIAFHVGREAKKMKTNYDFNFFFPDLKKEWPKREESEETLCGKPHNNGEDEYKNCLECLAIKGRFGD